MNLTRRGLLALMGATGLAACQKPQPEEPASKPEDPTPEPAPKPAEPEEPQVDLTEFEELALDMDAWSYDEAGDCYYQLGLPYCLKPGSIQYESLSLFVPGPYFVGTKHGKHYRCELAPDAQVGGFTPATAPIVLPINGRTYGAQECPGTYSYEGLDRYLKAGIVYAYAGFRGRTGGYESTTQEYFAGGAPWPVVDLKAAVRFLRYNASVLPADVTRVFACGQGGGAGLAATLGTSGNAPAFDPYLEELGAATHDAQGNPLTDVLQGLALWCPLSSLGIVDGAYEWMMGQYSSEGTRADGTWTQLLSHDLAASYGSYVNDLGLQDAEGKLLTLDQIDDGSYAGGSYYEHLLDVIEEAAEDFFARTEFPYTQLPALEGERFFPGDPSLHAGVLGYGSADGDSSSAQGASGVRQVQATVYDSVESYVSSLNGGDRWLTYSPSQGSVDITGLWGFSRACRQAEADVCAYDRLDRSGFANQLFGTDTEPSLHFDALLARLVERNADRYAQAEGWDESLVAASRGDLAETDAQDVTVAERVTMMDPLTYLMAAGETEEGAADEQDGGTEATQPQAVAVAPHWRISTGLFQSESTLAGEVNLAATLVAHEGVRDVLFQGVWEAGYGLAERTGDPEDNLVAWVISCCPEPEPDAQDEQSSDNKAGGQ